MMQCVLLRVHACACVCACVRGAGGWAGTAKIRSLDGSVVSVISNPFSGDRLGTIYRALCVQEENTVSGGSEQGVPISFVPLTDVMGGIGCTQYNVVHSS
jgi:hypothetical protein